MDPKLKETFDRVWPKTKVELEKALRTTQILIHQGEKNVKMVSEQSLLEIKKLAVQLKTEALYLKLGRTVARISPDQWAGHKRVNALLKEVRRMDRVLGDLEKKNKQRPTPEQGPR